MNQERKNQLNEKLHQIYEHGSGLTEGIIESLVQETFLGHTYFIHEIKRSHEYPATNYTEENKTYTMIEFGLYQEGEGCISNFDVPASAKHLQDIAARIDMAYYQWMKRDPQILYRQAARRYEYYEWLLAVILPSVKSMVIDVKTKEEFEAMPSDNQSEIIDEAEWHAFLPPRNTGINMEERP